MIVFGLEDGQASYLGATLGHADEIIRLVGLHVGGGARVRTCRSGFVLSARLWILRGLLDQTSSRWSWSTLLLNTPLHLLAKASILIAV